MQENANLIWLAEQLAKKFTSPSNYGDWLKNGIISIALERQVPTEPFVPGQYVIGEANPNGRAWMIDMAVVHHALPADHQAFFDDGFRQAFQQVTQEAKDWPDRQVVRLGMAFAGMARHIDPQERLGIPKKYCDLYDPDTDMLKEFLGGLAVAVNNAAAAPKLEPM